MQFNVDLTKHPYGLGGGTVLTGSVQIAGEFFWFYPVSSSVANVKFSNMTYDLGSIPHTNGVGIYGAITEVTQSSGASIVYNAPPDNPTYNTFANYPSVTPTITPSNTPSISISVSATPLPTPTVTPSVTASPSVTPSVTPSISVTPSKTATPSATPTPSPSSGS